jgi:hypothetical protein
MVVEPLTMRSVFFDKSLLNILLGFDRGCIYVVAFAYNSYNESNAC